MEENGNNLPRCTYKIPSIFTILSLRILFLGTTAIFAGAVSGDWEATFCSFFTPLSPSLHFPYSPLSLSI